MRNSIKYILIVSTTIIFNFILWKIGNDCLTKKINDLTDLSVITTSVFVGLVNLFVIFLVRWGMNYLSFIPKTKKTKIFLAIVITLLFFGRKTITNLKNLSFIIPAKNNERLLLCNKIKQAEYLAFGTTGTGLTFEEYIQIKNLVYLPSISEKAYDISYLYSYDGFLPDYRLELDYKIPKNITLPEFEEEVGNDFSKSQSIFELDNYNVVHYLEFVK